MASELAQDTTGPLAVEAFRRAAESLTLAISICEAEGVALTELQVGCVLQAIVHSFDGTQSAFASMLTIESEIRAGRFPLRTAIEQRDPEVGR